MQGPAIQSWTKHPSGPAVLDLLLSNLELREEGKRESSSPKYPSTDCSSETSGFEVISGA